MPPSLRSLASAGLFTAFVACVPGAAHAVAVNVGGIDYDVQALTAAYPLNPALFALPPTGQMPWWGDDSLASEFAFQVLASLGPGYSNTYGPVFAFSHDDVARTISGITQNIEIGGENDQLRLEGATALADYLDPTDSSTVNSYIFAYVPAITPPASSSVPAPLPLFGAAAAVTWSRRIKGRFVLGKR